MNDVHTYRFHTSILSANRQIYHEASNVFYLENLFIRVNAVTSGLVSPFFRIPTSAAHGEHHHLVPLPMFSNGSKLQACTRHVMEIDLFPCSPSVLPERQFRFILAADDLRLLCRRLLQTDAIYWDMIGLLQETGLWITVGDEVLTLPTSEKSAECLNAATKNASACRGERPSYIWRRAVEWSACTGEETNSNETARGIRTTEGKFRLSGSPYLLDTPRLRRLFEPLRALHSIGSSYIDAPISERYREVIQTSLFRARPSVQDQFPILLSAYEEAMRTFRAGYATLAVQQLRGTLDIWDEITWLHSRDASTELATGSFAGFTLSRALQDIRYDLFKSLTRAYLAVCAQPQVTARMLSKRILVSYNWFGQWGQGLYDRAMTLCLMAEMWEALDEVGVYCDRPRSEYLGKVIATLTTALQVEPTNTTLQQLLRRMQRAKAVADALEEREGEGDEEGGE